MLKYLKTLSKRQGMRSNPEAFIRLNLFVKTDLLKWLDQHFEDPSTHKGPEIQGGFLKTGIFEPLSHGFLKALLYI